MGSQLMTVGLRAVAANYTQIQVTGNNIANANVQGYSRQRAELVVAAARFTGGGFIGLGVDVKTITRDYDALRAREAMTAQSVARMEEARLRGLTQLESVFPVGEEGLGHATSQFLNALSDVASRPTDVSARQVVLARAADVATGFVSSARRIQEIQAGVVEEVGAGVEKVNQLAAGIAEVNDRLSRTQALTHSANDLLDERDRLLLQLNEVIQTTNYFAEDGSLTVMIRGGHTLVLGNRSNALARVNDPQDPSRVALASVQMGVNRPIQQADLTGGSLAGWIRLQNDDLVAARNEVGRMAGSLAAVVNEQQSLGLDLRGVGGLPIFAVGPPQVVAAGNNVRKPDGTAASVVTVAISDARQLAASEYELRKPAGAAAGEWEVVRLADGYTRTVKDGDEVDGFKLGLPTPEPAASDSFLIKPVAAAASGMRRVLDDPRALAAAAPLTATSAGANRGTAAVEDLRATRPPSSAALDLKVVFTSDTGQYEFRDGAGQPVGAAPRQWKAGEPIVFEGQTGTVNGVPGTYDAFELELVGSPLAGDSFGLKRTAFAAANNGNAQAMLALRDTAFVGRTVDSQGMPSVGRTFTDAYAAAVGQVGVTVQRGRTAASISEGVARAAETARASSAGVSLDEEAARLLQFQQSYQAGSKVLQAAQTVFDALLEVVR
jgi:flagellar hook-associated protein 1 FlgK